MRDDRPSKPRLKVGATLQHITEGAITLVRVRWLWGGWVPTIRTTDGIEGTCSLQSLHNHDGPRIE